MDRIFGEITGIPEGSEFENRFYLSQYGVHRPLQAGISGSQTEGADDTEGVADVVVEGVADAVFEGVTDGVMEGDVVIEGV